MLPSGFDGYGYGSGQICFENLAIFTAWGLGCTLSKVAAQGGIADLHLRRDRGGTRPPQLLFDTSLLGFSQSLHPTSIGPTVGGSGNPSGYPTRKKREAFIPFFFFLHSIEEAFILSRKPKLKLNVSVDFDRSLRTRRKLTNAAVINCKPRMLGRRIQNRTCS